MKIRKVTLNNRKKELTITTYSATVYSIPYTVLEPSPSTDNRIKKVFVDKELAKEAITYILESGDEGSVHIEQILEYNEDPEYLAELLIYKLSLQAQQCIADSALSRRQIAARLKTSVPQLYRLLDPGNTKKSMKQLIALLHILNCNVDFVITKNAA